MFGNKGADYEYKIDEVNIANIWNPNAENPREFGGFNFSVEDKIIRWLHRGDTLYDVIIPEDAEVVELEEGATPHGVFRSNKIIVTNPRKVTDEMALEFYRKSDIPEFSYYKALAAVSVMDYKNTALAILKDKVREDNIDTVLDEWNDFISYGGKGDRVNANETVILIERLLKEIKSPIDITRFIDREPYIKKFTDDKVINVTGQSGSGKSTYVKEHFNDDSYLVVDTDDVLTKDRFSSVTGINKEIGEYLRNKYEVLPNLADDFDLIYKEILDYTKNFGKTLVIDCAQFHMIKDLRLLKGTLIIIRTSIDTCYHRCIERYKKQNPDCTVEMVNQYAERKKGIFEWCKGSNDFLEKVDKL